MSLTNIQLINLALKQAGLDSSFQTDARTWLNHISRTEALRQDYPKFRKSSDITFVSGQRAYNLPSDFLRSDMAYIYEPSTGKRGSDILIMQDYMFEKYRITANGNPSVAVIDENNSQIVFNTLPNDTSKACRLWYFREPTAIATDSTNDGDIPDFPDQDFLKDKLMEYAYEFLEDKRENKKGAQAEKTKREFQKNMYNDDSYSQVPLESTHFRPTRGRGRGRGF